MIVNVNSSAEDYDETQHVLQYASTLLSSSSLSSAAVPLQEAVIIEYDYNGRPKKRKLHPGEESASRNEKKKKPIRNDQHSHHMIRAKSSLQ